MCVITDELAFFFCLAAWENFFFRRTLRPAFYLSFVLELLIVFTLPCSYAKSCRLLASTTLYEYQNSTLIRT